MNSRIRNIIIIVLLAAIVVTFHIVRRNATMRGLEISVVDRQPNIITADDVDSILMASFPSLTKTDIKDIDRDAIVDKLCENPYILEASAHTTTGGKLQVNVTPRIPVVRMFYQDNEFYISHEGTFMPITAKHYCYTLIGNSNAAEPRLKKPSGINLADTAVKKQPSSLVKVWKTASYLYDNPAYGDIFDQVSIAENGDICLVPKLGQLTVILGDTTQMQTKFENLWAFLDQGISLVGWNTYSTINLKYKNQVVCTKKQ